MWFKVIQYCTFCPKNRAKVLKKTGIFKKMHFFCIFFQKYLVISKKSSTFAPAFEKKVRHNNWCGSSVG